MKDFFMASLALLTMHYFKIACHGDGKEHIQGCQPKDVIQ